MLELGQSVRSPPPEEEGMAETCDELIITSITCPPAPLGGEGGGRETGWKLGPGRREEWL